jgi:hypothetical protein
MAYTVLIRLVPGQQGISLHIKFGDMGICNGIESIFADSNCLVGMISLEPLNLLIILSM